MEFAVKTHRSTVDLQGNVGEDVIDGGIPEGADARPSPPPLELPPRIIVRSVNTIPPDTEIHEQMTMTKWLRNDKWLRKSVYNDKHLQQR